MSELGTDARTILDAARGGDDPTDADRKRVHSSLARRLGVGAAILGTTTATSASAGGATIAAGISSMTKVVVLVVGMVGVLGGGTYVVHRLTTPRPTPTTVATTHTITPTPTPLPDPTIAAPEPPAAPLAPLATTATTAPMPPPTATASPKGFPAGSVAKKSSFDDELAASQQVQAVLGSDPQKALALLDEQSKQWPNGAFAQERAGMRVIALCELAASETSASGPRRADARAQAEKFLAANPQSPMALRIRSACKLTD